VKGKILKFLSIAWLVTLLMNYFKKTSKRTPGADKKGNIVLKLSMVYGIIGLLSFILGAAVLVYGLIEYDPEDIGAQIGIFVLFGGLGFLVILITLTHRIFISDKEITQRTILGKRKSIMWEDIKNAKFNPASDYLVIMSDEKKIRCEPFLIGFPVLVKMLEDKVGIKLEQLEIPESRI
jgi:hypothetical protein